jgi:diadenosine tetraphosphate (Ap4A) HIT family hydrolase
MKATHLLPGCHSCDRQASTTLPPREDIIHSDHWQVAHAFNSTLPGWLVLVPTSHVTTFTELAPAAADELGPLILRCSAALEAVTGCVKTYLMQFSEAEGFTHLHLHLVPRMSELPEGARGPRVFTYMSEDPQQWIPAADLDALALALRAELG